MKIIKLNKISTDKIVMALKNCGLVIMPTETVYGAMVDATNLKSVKKLTQYKNRPFGKPYSIAVTDITMAKKFVSLNDTAIDLYEKFLPGPVTVISKGKGKVAKGVESEMDTLGVRIPDYKLVIDVIKKLGKPLTATSANASYKKRPYKISDILDNLSEKQKSQIDLIIDAGELPRNEPSTVIDTTLEDSVILRQGDIKLKEKNEILSRSEENTKNLAKELWQKYETHKRKRSIVFALEGEMGTGKTIFTKGLAKAMDLKDDVVSPSYSLEEEYDGGKLYHIDTWRMEDPDELCRLGFTRRIKNRKVIVIEWADKVADEIKKHDDEAIIIWVKIKYGKNENERKISWGVL